MTSEEIQTKRVLVFSTAYFPHMGGAEVAIKELTDRMNGWQFDMITAKMDGRLANSERMGNVNVYRVGLGFAFFDKFFFLPILGFFKALSLHKQNNYNLAWSMMASQASVAASFFKIFRPKTKLVLTLQEGDEEEHLKRYVFNIEILYKIFIRPWHLLVFKKADQITAISYYLKNRAIENKVSVPVEIVANGVDVALFSSSLKIGLDKIRGKLGVKIGEKIVITTSRLVKKNGVDDLIKAMEYLPVHVKLLIMGDGLDREKLEKLARDLSVNGRVIFFGRYDYNILPEYFAVSDVFVRPSLSEGQGISFLEAMISGVPIVGTPVGGITDFLFDPEKNPDKPPTGLFCEVRNSESIAEKVKLLLENGDLRAKITKNARELVIKNYDWNLISVKMREVFEGLLKK